MQTYLINSSTAWCLAEFWTKSWTTRSICALVRTSYYKHHLITPVFHHCQSHTESRSQNPPEIPQSSFAHYHKCKFKIQMVVADNQFNCLSKDLVEMQIQMTPLSKGEHEKFMEKNNNFVKEWCRCSLVSFPYNKLSHHIIRDNEEDDVLYTNYFTENEFLEVSLPGTNVGNDDEH